MIKKSSVCVLAATSLAFFHILLVGLVINFSIGTGWCGHKLSLSIY